MRRFLATTIKPRCLGVAMAALMGIATSWSGKAEGAFITVFDRTAFLNATFATSAGPIPDSNLSTFDFTYPSGDVTIESAADPETHFLVIGFGGGGNSSTVATTSRHLWSCARRSATGSAALPSGEKSVETSTSLNGRSTGVSNRGRPP